MKDESWDIKLFSGGVLCMCELRFGFELLGMFWGCVWERFGNVLSSLKLKLGGSEGILSTEVLPSFT
jgi:hypothetical protein